MRRGRLRSHPGLRLDDLTSHDVLVDDLNMVIAIGSRVFVPEAHHVPQFMNHDSELVAVLADRNGLRPIASPADKRTASVRPIQSKSETRNEKERTRHAESEQLHGRGLVIAA